MELIVCPLAHALGLYSTHHEALKSTLLMREPQWATVGRRGVSCSNTTEGSSYTNEGSSYTTEREGVSHREEPLSEP